jgi:hypothetical protein
MDKQAFPCRNHRFTFFPAQISCRAGLMFIVAFNGFMQCKLMLGLSLEREECAYYHSKWGILQMCIERVRGGGLERRYVGSYNGKDRMNDG